MNKAHVVPINDKEYYLLQEFSHEWSWGHDSFKVIVPEEFITDLASIPKPFWSLLGLKPDGLYRDAAIVHDYLYAFRGLPPKNRLKTLKVSIDGGASFVGATSPLSRKECDKIFLEMMEGAGVDGWKAKVMHRAVRLFGEGPW